MEAALSLDQDDTAAKGLFAGHPKGLPILYFTEMWERFSYYGMRAILVLYMVAKGNEGGLGFSMYDSAQIYGTYTMLVYMSSIPGGFVADKFFGYRKSVLLGGIIIALGHFTMVFSSQPAFYAGLGLIIMGTGLLKPNMSSMVGNLYPPGDKRRDSGFSIFYMGVNVGGAIAPIACGFLAQSSQFKAFLASHGVDPLSSWHFGFGAAGIGMMLGLTQYVLGRRKLDFCDKRSDPLEPSKVEKNSASSTSSSSATENRQGRSGFLGPEELQRIGAIAILFVFAMLFWTIYEQGGSSLNVFALRLTDCHVFGYEFPSSWLQSFQAIFVVILAPVFSILWTKLGAREPSSPVKFSLGLFFLACGILLMVPAAALAHSGKVSFLWLVFVYLFEVIGELCLSPVGLSTVTKLAPLRFLGLTMGIWYLTSAFGNRLAGFFAGSFNPDDLNSIGKLYGGMGVAALLAGGILLLLVPRVKKLMAGVH